MKAIVLVERISKKKFRASISQPITLQTEGKSRDEAIERLRKLAAKRLANGELVQITLTEPPETNPWLQYAGIWKDHPDFEEFLENIEDYRRSKDAVKSLR